MYSTTHGGNLNKEAAYLIFSSQENQLFSKQDGSIFSLPSFTALCAFCPISWQFINLKCEFSIQYKMRNEKINVKARVLFTNT